MDLSWGEYKKIVEDFFKSKFDKCKLIEDYENEISISKSIYDFYNEDNSYIKYFCRSLEFFMLDYQKKYYGLKRGKNKKYKRCKECGKLIEDTGNKKTYCQECSTKREKERKKRIAYKYRKVK